MPFLSCHFPSNTKYSILIHSCYRSGMASRSIAEYQLVDRTWFCTEFTRYL